MANEKLEVCKLPRSGQIASEYVQAGGRGVSFGYIKLAIIGGIRKTYLKSRWIK
jgi:hypothetical protein